MRAKKIIPWIIATALFMETLDVTIINTAIPDMALSFGVNPLNLKIALTSYLLSLAVFIPISGWIADKWGSQRTFIFALIMFTMSSIGCGNASYLSELVIFRIMQGVGGAFMMPVGRLILLRTFPKAELIRATNFMTTPALFGPLLGPVVGGFITTYYSWPWIFYVNVPMGILGVCTALFYIKNSKAEALRKFDWIGFFLFSISLSVLFFVFDVINERMIPFYVIVLLFCLAAVGFVFFYLHYRKTRNPILNLKLFSFRTFLIAGLGNIWSRLGLSSVSFLLPLLFQVGYGLSPRDSGLLICSWTLGMISMKFINKAILKKLGFRNALCMSAILVGITIASFSLINKINVPFIFALVFINGVVSSLQFLGMNVLYYTELDQQDMSNAISIASTLQQLSMGLGITVSALVVQLFAKGDVSLLLNNPLPFRYAFLVTGAIVFFSLFIFLRLKPHDGQEMV